MLGRPDAVTVKQQAVDLGVPVHYSRASLPSDGPTRVRRARILADRILAASDDILIRARLIRGALYPKILYGMEFRYLNKADIARIRRAASNALAGSWHNANPAIVCHTLCHVMWDPVVYILRSALNMLARWHFRSPDQAMPFVRRVAQFKGRHAQGPASSLALYLHSVGLTMLPTGEIRGVGPFAFNPLSCSSAETGKIAPAIIGDRKGTPGDAMWDFMNTRDVFTALPKSDRKIAQLSVAGVVCSGTRKQLWDLGIEEELCQLCNAPDDMPHRLLTCEATSALDWPEDALVFYTDGACAFPTQPAARYAAWAVVRDHTSIVGINQLAHGIPTLSANCLGACAAFFSQAVVEAQQLALQLVWQSDCSRSLK